MDAYIAQWAKQVKASSEDNRHLNQLEREAQAVKKLQIARRSKPLTEQIEELMLSIPSSLRTRPWSMAELTAQLQGKYRDRPHPQLVGAALRKLGWSRVRLYGNGFDGVRVWMPAGGCLIN